MSVGSLMGQLERLIQRLREGPVVATIVVAVLTLVLVGGAVLTMTSLGCGPAKALGLKGITARCAGDQTAARPSPSPSEFPSLSPSPIGSPSAPQSPVLPSPTFPSSNPNPPTGTTGSPAYPLVADSSGGSGPTPSKLSCNLPVYVGPAGSGGFIAFPTDTFVADPGSAVALPSPSPGGPAPSPTPGYPGQYAALSYDHAYSRWLPASLQAVSADGALYAFALGQAVYVVTVSSGILTELGQGHTWTVLAVGPAGVYTTVPNTGGLWLLPLSGSSAQQVVSTGFWQGVGGGAAYGTATSAVPQGTANTILKLDLTTGAVTNYFTRPGEQSQVAGFDGHGDPVIYSSGSEGSEVWVGNSLFLMAMRHSQGWYGGTYRYLQIGFQPTGSPVSDRHGLWFTGYFGDLQGSSGSAIALWIPGTGVYLVSFTTVQLAGGCN